MRIALVTTSYPETEHDPAGHFVRAEARSLARLGHDVVVLAPDGRAQADGIDVLPIRGGGAFGWPGVGARLRARPTRVVGVARWAVRLRAALARAGPFDRIVAHWAVPCGILVAGHRGLVAPLELVSHGADVRALAGAPAWLRRRTVRALAARASVWRFVSTDLRDALLARVGAAEQAAVEAIATVAAPEIELPEVAVDGARRRTSSSERIVVCVGRIVASKRVDRVIRYAARAHADKRLVVVGDGPDRERVEKIARVRGARVTFTGKLPRDEALAWMAASDALLFASEAEGCSTVVREAEALGVRVERISASE